MANTGWRIGRSILKVALNNNTKKLDRDGLECNLIDSEGIPVSASGKKQAAKILASIDPNTETPVGQVKTYSELYDITDTYTVDTAGVPTGNLIYQDGVVVGEYRGGELQECGLEQVVVFESDPIEVTLTEWDGEEGITLPILITSSLNGTSVGWIVESNPSWVSLSVGSSQITITGYSMNSGDSERVGSIVLKQNITGEILTIPVTQAFTEIVFQVTPASVSVSGGGITVPFVAFEVVSSITELTAQWSLTGETPWISIRKHPEFEDTKIEILFVDPNPSTTLPRYFEFTLTQFGTGRVLNIIVLQNKRLV